MTNRITIYVGEPLTRLLAHHENRSGRINTVAARYLEIVQRESPELTEREWRALCDALNGTLIDDLATRFIWAEIADADRLNRLGAKWGIDAQALAVRLRDMRHPELVALAEVVDRFWAGQPSDDDNATALAKAGARIREAQT